MYLSKTRLLDIVDKVISSPEGDASLAPFDKVSQVNVCSIDVRVDRVFWRMKVKRFKRRQIDLGDGGVNAISPRRLWERVHVSSNEYIVLKPGEMLLARVYEKITMPPEYVGKITTRSSYARLGISTGCNCDLINPGYSGHVPLELVNFTKTDFKIRPFLPMAQIFLMPISDVAATSAYGGVDASSMYQDDDGGPSVWWRDRLVRKAAQFSSATFSLESIDKLKKAMKDVDDKGFERFEASMEMAKDAPRFANVSEFLKTFNAEEKKRKNRSMLLKSAVSLIGAGFFVALLPDLVESIKNLSIEKLRPIWADLIDHPGIYLSEVVKENSTTAINTCVSLVCLVLYLVFFLNPTTYYDSLKLDD